MGALQPYHLIVLAMLLVIVGAGIWMVARRSSADTKPVRILGLVSLVLIVIGLASIAVQANQTDIWGEPQPVTTPPVLIAGGVMGVAWLIVKAVRARQ